MPQALNGDKYKFKSVRDWREAVNAARRPSRQSPGLQRRALPKLIEIGIPLFSASRKRRGAISSNNGGEGAWALIK